MLKMMFRDIFDLIRLMIRIRKEGHAGDVILMRDTDYKATLDDRQELFAKTLLLWNVVMHVIKGGSACDYCLFNQCSPCLEKTERGCPCWCLRDLTEDERQHGVKELEENEPSATTERSEENTEVHEGADEGTAESPVV